MRKFAPIGGPDVAFTPSCRPGQRRRVWLLAAAFSLAAGVARGQAAGSGRPAPDAPLSRPGIFQEAGEIFQEVSRLRGLPILHPVAMKLENRAFFRAYYLRQLQKQYPPAKKAAIEKAYGLLGFLPRGADLIRTYLDSFMKVVDGLYDPDTKTLYIADWIDPENQEQTLAHELDHALQDQYFNLRAYMAQSAKDTLDEQFARASIMEGGATAIALDYSLQGRGIRFTQLTNIARWMRLNNLFQEEGERAFGRKAVLHDVVNFPYVYGTAFLQKYIKVYGWQGMKYLFHHPPTSTHQIMHPETFFPRRQNPVGVEISDLSRGPLPGYHLVWADTMGEYGLFLLLREYLDEGVALQAVAGWRGDQVQVYERGNGEGMVLVGYVDFNGPQASDDFYSAYRELLDDKYRLALYRRCDDTIDWATVAGSGAEVYVERFGHRAVFIEGTGPEETAKVRGALWDIRKVEPAPERPKE